MQVSKGLSRERGYRSNPSGVSPSTASVYLNPIPALHVTACLVEDPRFYLSLESGNSSNIPIPHC